MRVARAIEKDAECADLFRQGPDICRTADVKQTGFIARCSAAGTSRAFLLTSVPKPALLRQRTEAQFDLAPAKRIP